MGKTRSKTLLAAAFLLLGSTLCSAQIAGSPHDFSGSSWNSSGEICIVCHTPHDAISSAQGAPLWNHEVTTAVFTLYSSDTLVVQPKQPQGVTRLCLSCHDGTVALDSFGGMSGSTYVSGDAKIGTDLRDDHPVSIKWQHQNDTPSCNNCHNTHGGGGNNLLNDILPFFDGYVECATCHDVHNGTPGNGHLLRLSLTGSQLCLHCHGK